MSVAALQIRPHFFTGLALRLWAPFPWPVTEWLELSFFCSRTGPQPKCGSGLSTPGCYCNYSSYSWPAFVVKLNPAGCDIVYGALFGGSGGQGQPVSAVAVDPDGGSHVDHSSNSRADTAPSPQIAEQAQVSVQYHYCRASYRNLWAISKLRRPK
jgi:hypothetical protein